jgi:hypothetical protein
MQVFSSFYDVTENWQLGTYQYSRVTKPMESFAEENNIPVDELLNKNSLPAAKN